MKEQQRPAVLALGFFDGVHKGHREVICKAKAIADRNKLESAVMTFYPHPREVLSTQKQNNKLEYITPLEEKIELIAALGVERLYVVRFSLEFSTLTPQQFVDDYLIALNIKHVVAGFDYTYGHLGKGTMETLPFHSRGYFEQTTIPKVEKGKEKVSSTRIREAILAGKVSSLPELLRRFYFVKGIVVHGEKRGRTIGYPTANVEVTRPFIIPKLGVYAVTIEIEEKTYKGVCNIGVKPTFNDNEIKPVIEVHIFDFQQSIYDEEVKVTFYEYIREEKKFASLRDLVNQLDKDSEKAKSLFNEENIRQ